MQSCFSLVLTLVLVVGHQCHSYRTDVLLNEGEDAGEFQPKFERRNDKGWCARWMDSCVPDAKLKFARCCAGLKCDCGSIFSTSNKCLCKKESLFGR